MQALTLKDRFWSFDRETEVSHVNRYTERSDYRHLCYSVIDAVIEIRQTNEILAKHIEAFANATECSFEFVFCCGGKQLMKAAHVSDLAIERLRSLVVRSRWRPRFNVMCLIGYQPPIALGLELLTWGLTDRSEKVAMRAAAACDDLGGTEALALLESRLPLESRAKVREVMDFTIELMHTPPVRNGRYEERTVRGMVISRDIGPQKKLAK